MKIADELADIEQALDAYRNLLDTIPDELFTQTPPMGGWSYAEVYAHILKATLYSTISLEKCTIGNCKPTAKGPNLTGRLMMLLGSFPPFKLQTTPELAAKMTPEKISKEDARNLIIRSRKRVAAMIEPLRNAPKDARMPHPSLGMLNAAQWFKFIRIHLQHHLKQIDRIKNNFAKR